MAQRVAPVSRRAFVAGAVGTFGALGMAAAGWPRYLEAAFAASSTLTTLQRETYVTLVRALGQAPGTRIDATAADAGLEVFATWYQSASEPGRRHASAILDLLEAGPADGFSALTPTRGRAFLRGWAAERSAEERAFERDAASIAEGRPERAEDLREFLELEAAAIRARAEEVRRVHGPDALKVNPETGHANWEPQPDQTVRYREWSWPLTTDAERHRFVAGEALGLAALPFYPDPALAPF